jgi:RNA polymerase sigma factor (TIGR02999 family)
MRQVLVEAARRRNSHKRGGSGEVIFVPLEDSPAPSPHGEDVLALEEVLQELERTEPRQALLVESRFYGGLEMAQIAELLHVSEITIHRDWRAVKAWLAYKLRPAD